MSCEDRITSMIDRLIYHQDLLLSHNADLSNINVIHNNIPTSAGHIDCEDTMAAHICKVNSRSTSADRKSNHMVDINFPYKSVGYQCT